MADMVNGYLVDVEAGIVESVRFEACLHEYCRLIGCDCIDIVIEQMGGVLVSVIVDDEGLLKDSPRLAIRTANEGLYGSSLVLGFDRGTRDVRGLTDAEMAAVGMCVRFAAFSDGTLREVMVTDDIAR